MSLFAFDKLSGEVSLIDHPMNGSVPASATQLMELLAQSPYADCEILDANIAALFNPSKSNQSRVVARAVNARLNVNIDEPLMMAEGELICARGGEILDLDNAVRQLREAGIKKGISRKALELLLAKQFELPPGGRATAIVAVGRKAKSGEDARFIRLCATAQDRVLCPKEAENGKVDMRDLGDIITVKPGSPLMQRVPATAGEPGYNLFGEQLAPKPGRQFPLEVMEGTRLDSDNENLLVADAVGVPVALARGVRVDDVLCYDFVDATTGHIRFEGSVIVSGDVKDAMQIVATGDITVLGFVESATLQSDNEITVVKGVIGRKRDESEPCSCRIQAKRSVSIGYAQYSDIQSQQDIFIDRQALHCELSARRLIRVGRGKNPRGKLIGGFVSNALRIETGELGAPSGTRTKVYLGQYYYELKQKRKTLAEQQKRINEKFAALQVLRKKALKEADNDKRKRQCAHLDKHEAQWVAIKQGLEKKKRLVQQRINMLLGTSRVRVNDLMHPGVELKIAHDTTQISRIYPPHSALLSEGKITQQFPL
ncbi:hypothetical protein FIU82_05255 [Pseudoalteromonas sp. THAF3]|uniref:DUF342 domain-containing protein n=1 Tax=Pseudoalteromonas sp. THAF3 TaxID=2587843 RepID=UPI0012690164|nr:FapA family protein [Pseudoalteromonas sp. THAF3]QFU04430.1 hypothetical protein FIU82_05255 [Pseudoalteromonas sp. THAF3]